MRIPPAVFLAGLFLGAVEAHAGAAATQLFNGKDLDGWEYIASGQPAKIGDACKVADGVISVVGTPGKSTGYIVAPGSHRDYQLHVEWRWTGPAITANTNGGILLNVTDGTLQQGLWPVSFQVQTKNARAGDVIAMSTASSAEAPAGQTVSRRKDSSEKPPGEWNAADITVRGNTISAAINGVLQNTVTNCSPASGRIGFQLEGYAYELRNLRLVPLEAEKTPSR